MRFLVPVLAAICIVFSSASLAQDRHWPVPKGAMIHEVATGIIAGYENHPDVLACRGFTLTPEQILALFHHARVVNFHELHYEFDWAPCIVTGKMSWGKEVVTWQISAMLVAEIHYKDGRKIALGCDEKCQAVVYPNEGQGGRATPASSSRHPARSAPPN